MLPRTKQVLIGGVALVGALALPALAQDRPESLLPPDFGEPTPAPQPVANESQPRETTRPQQQPPAEGGGVQVVDLIEALEEMTKAEPVPQVEYPAEVRRDPRLAGTLDPA